jgi:hypothetical protein
MWGHVAPGAAPPAVVPAAAAAAAAVAATAAAPALAAAAPSDAAAPPLAGGEGGLPPVPPTTAPAAKEWPRWPLWALLGLLLFGAAAWGIMRYGDTLLADDAGLAEQIAQADARNRTLEEELARKRNADAAQQCVMDTPPPVSAAASAPEPPASAAVAEAAPSQPAPTPPAPSPLDALKQRIADSGKNCESLSKMLKQEPLLQGSGSEASALKQRIMRSLEQNCRETAIREAKNLCPGQRPKELAPEMVIVFDASGSMNYSLDVTEAQIRQSGEAAAVESLMRQFLGGRATGTNPMLEKLTREP